MKKTTLSELLDLAKSDPSEIDDAAFHLTHELAGDPITTFGPDGDSEATSRELKQACISLVRIILKTHNLPSEEVVEMLEWAIGLRPGKRKRGPPAKTWKRDTAILEELYWLCPGYELPFIAPMSVRELAKRVGVDRATIRTWRKDPKYQRAIEEMIPIYQSEIEEYVGGLKGGTG